MKKLWAWLIELDRIIRGERTRMADLPDGQLHFPLAGVTAVVALLGMIYGVCLGVYAVVNHHNGLQMLAVMFKVPSLFFLTLLVTLPSLYVFNAIIGSRLTAGTLVRLFVAALAVNLSVLASLGPIVAFFSLNTTSYSFMVLLNVAVFALSGVLGVAFLLQTLHRLNLKPAAPQPDLVNAAVVEATSSGKESQSTSSQTAALAPASVEAHGPLSKFEGGALGARVKLVFGCWMFLFALVGAQMGWVLRLFIGSSPQFVLFQPRTSNFFEAVLKSLEALLR